MKTAARKVMWVGRATVFLVGLAMTLAFAVGLASTALAGTGVGARFDLGKTNAVNALTKLVGAKEEGGRRGPRYLAGGDRGRRGRRRGLLRAAA